METIFKLFRPSIVFSNLKNNKKTVSNKSYREFNNKKLLLTLDKYLNGCYHKHS